LLQVVVDSLIRTAELSLLAVGLTMVYGLLRFANFAHIEFATLGAYLALFFSTTLGAPLVVAGLAAIALCGGAGVATDRAIFSRLRTASPILLMIASFGLSIVIREGIRAAWGPSGFFYELGVLPPLRFLGLTITPTQILVVVTAAVAMLAFYALLTWTRLGITMRATADNAALSQASGVNSDRVIAIVWFIGTGFAALGGVLIAVNTQLKPDIGVGLAIEVFAAAIVGGIGNPYGAMLGAALVGFAENVGLAINWAPLLSAIGLDAGEFAFIPTSYKAAVAFTILIATLLIRPRGLLGQRA
jgi:branched-subunit amino acid ABC-type transport system permease component